MNNKELAATCSFFEAPGKFIDEKGKPTCLAHLHEGRVFDCGVYEGYSHVGPDFKNRCADFDGDRTTEIRKPISQEG